MQLNWPQLEIAKQVTIIKYNVIKTIVPQSNSHELIFSD